MNKLRKWWSTHKKAAERRRAYEFAQDFRVVERNGKMYLTCCGTAFAEISTHASASEIVTLLNYARKAALEFEGVHGDCSN